MKIISMKALVILALTLAVWTVFYIVTPDAKLTHAATVVVAAISAAIVHCTHWMWVRLRGRIKNRGSDVKKRYVRI